MNRKIIFHTIVILTALLMAWSAPASASISDGSSGGNEHFFFLPPIVSKPNHTGIFEPNIYPVVRICELTGNECSLPLIAEFTALTGPSSQTIRVDVEDEHYVVNWKPKLLDETKTYRIRVLFTLPGEDIEKELGFIDLTDIDKATIPIRFRIEEGSFPLGELPTEKRAKISTTLLDEFISQEIIEPIEALVNIYDIQAAFPDFAGLEIVQVYENLGGAFVRISNPDTLALLVESQAVRFVHENRIYHLLATHSEITGADVAAISGYTGAGTAVAILDSGGGTITGLPLPDDSWVIDISRDEFGACTAVGSPASCRVVAMVDFKPNDPFTSRHMTKVANTFAQTAPGANIVAMDVFAGGYSSEDSVVAALEWVYEHQAEFNIVAVNMSFGNGLFQSAEECDEGRYNWYFQRVREVGVMPVAASGNNGWGQRNYDGINHPACSPLVVSVGSSRGAGEFEDSTTRGPNLDLLAPAGTNDTSNAAPQVSGARAILSGAPPELGIEETRALLRDTGVPILDPDSGLTFPRIQIDDALRAMGLPIVETECPCFGVDDLNAIEWDIWCRAQTFEYLLDNSSTNDPYPILGTDYPSENGSTPACFTGKLYDTVEQPISNDEAESCLALLNGTAANQGTREACRID